VSWAETYEGIPYIQVVRVSASSSGRAVPVTVPSPHLGALQELLARTEATIRFPYDEPVALPMTHLEALGLVSRSRGLYSAARLLLENDRVNEAWILTRPLFTDALRLEYFAKASEQIREELLIGRELASVDDFLAKFHRLNVSLGEEGLSAKEIQGAEARRKNVLARAARKGIRKPRKSYPSERDLARRFGYLEELWMFEVSHDAVHGSGVAQTLRRFPLGDGEMGIAERNSEFPFLAGTATFAMGSALRAAKFGGQVLGVSGSACDKVLDDVARFSEILEGGGSERSGEGA
jgi:hypothetical protein